ncbi:MAG: hypothetical protein M0R70_12370 [Nitrospirae bacterium]|nr:hypothetical protein [Nitrospirota bacterium]
MSITIFASGKIACIGDIPRLIADLKRVAGEHNWGYHVIDDDFDTYPNAVLTPRSGDDSAAVIEGSLGLKGIVMNVGLGAEPLAILFDRSGVLTDMLQQVSWIHNNGQGERFTMCKTQFAGIKSHIRVIELLDGLKQSYIPGLIVNDEGDYWESRDRRILAEKRIFLGQCLRHAEKVISGIEICGDDVQDTETIASHIEDALLKADEEDSSQH